MAQRNNLLYLLNTRHQMPHTSVEGWTLVVLCFNLVDLLFSLVIKQDLGTVTQKRIKQNKTFFNLKTNNFYLL